MHEYHLFMLMRFKFSYHQDTIKILLKFSAKPHGMLKTLRSSTLVAYSSNHTLTEPILHL